MIINDSIIEFPKIAIQLMTRVSQVMTRVITAQVQLFKSPPVIIVDLYNLESVNIFEKCCARKISTRKIAA